MSRRKHTPIYVAGGCFFVLLMALSLLVRKSDHAPAPRTLADIRQAAAEILAEYQGLAREAGRSIGFEP